MRIHEGLNTDLKQIEEATKHRLNSLTANKSACSEMPSHVAALNSAATTADYNQLPASVLSAFTEFDQKFGTTVCEEAVRLLMLSTMTRWYERNLQNPFESTTQLREIRNRETRRLLADITEPEHGDSIWQLSNDILMKDLQCYTGKLVPCGAQIVDLHSGVPRSVLKSDGMTRLMANLKFFRDSGGFKDYFEIHTHTPTLFEFNETGWELCYHRIADLLRENVNAKGMLGGSWFYDPALDDISPRLEYLRKTPLENGARIFKVGRNEASDTLALATSTTRRNLHEKGHYNPMSYTLVWPREALLNWSERITMLS